MIFSYTNFYRRISIQILGVAYLPEARETGRSNGAGSVHAWRSMRMPCNSRGYRDGFDLFGGCGTLQGSSASGAHRRLVSVELGMLWSGAKQAEIEAWGVEVLTSDACSSGRGVHNFRLKVLDGWQRFVHLQIPEEAHANAAQ